MNKNYRSSPVGNNICCVMHGVSENILNDYLLLKKILIKALEKDNFGVLEEVSHKFEPVGFSIVVLLSESHASIHTYPEYNSLVFNLYSCRCSGDGKKVVKFLKEGLNPGDVEFFERDVVVEKRKK